jgi:alanyl aminopeptidase
MLLIGWILCPFIAFAADAVRPTRYELNLRILPKLPTFDGKIRIDLALERSTGSIRLNARDLTVRAAFLRTAGTRIPLRFNAAGEETIGANLPTPAGPGSASLEIEYTGRLSEQENVGAFRRRLGGDWYVFTTFTAIEARRAFPCFDDPGFKTPWKLTLHVERGQVAAANAPIAFETDEPAGMKRVEFAPTRRLPSELVAFAVGPFDVVGAGVAGQNRIPVRILVPHGRSREAEAARSATAGIHARLEQYTGMPYPWEKLDHVALVEGAFGATENPGLITYQEQILLAQPEHDTPERRRAMRDTMAHELAHQWFGNLVTQASWTDVWLSEGFASWMEGKIGGADMTQAARRSHVMTLDGSDKTRPVRVAKHTRAEMEDVYSVIIYQKGAAILAMLEDWLGAAAFQRGLARYLREHAGANATTDDLARALEAETGQSVAPVLHGLLDRPGIPVVGARIDCQRVIFEPRESPIPVCLHWEGGRQCAVAGPRQTEIRLDNQSCPTWISLNASGLGYYRAPITPANLQALMASSELTAPERLALADDLGAMVASGRFPAAAAMPALAMMARAREPYVALSALRTAAALAAVIPADLQGQYVEWLRTAFAVQPARPAAGESVRPFFKDKAPH